MIKIEIIKKKSHQNFIEEFTNDVLNNGTELIKNELKEKIKDLECETHKQDSFGTIFLNLTSQNNIEFGEFCCENFKNKIKPI